MMTRSAVALAFLLVTACNSHAAAPYVDGDGLASCAVFVSDFDGEKDNAEKRRFTRGRMQWMVGYLSAYNAANGQRFKTSAGVFGTAQQAKDLFAHWWLYDTCKLNPKATLHQAVQGFIAFRLREEQSPAQTPAAPETPCVRAKINGFHRAKERYADGTEKPVTRAMLDEWRTQCSQAKP